MIVTQDHIRAMIEGMRRVKRTPQRHWLEPIIERLEHLKPGDRLTIEVLDLHAEAQGTKFSSDSA